MNKQKQTQLRAFANHIPLNP